MPDFLQRMARASAARVAEAKRRESEAALRRRAGAAPAPPALDLSLRRFELFAEIKRRSPALGPLAAAGLPLVPRAAAYAAAGAAAISVVTEPDAFGGSLDDLREVARAVATPVMRKDFLVDPYQVFEARAAGASGVLLVLRLLDDARIGEMLEAADEAGLFLLLEAFDAADSARARELADGARPRSRWLFGVNARDLQTLAVDPARLEALAPALPPAWPRVAESGMETSADVRRAAALGYGVALVGGALMRSREPGHLLAGLLQAGREQSSRACAYE